MIRNATVIGYLGSKNELKETATGTKYLHFSLGSTYKQEDTIWFNLTVFGAYANLLSDILAIGDLVYVSGKITSVTEKGAINIIASDVRKLTSKTRDNENKKTAPSSSEDLPF